MSDPLGSSRHVSPLVRFNTHSPHSSQLRPHGDALPSPPLSEEIVQNHNHGPARSHIQPSIPSSSSTSPSPPPGPDDQKDPSAGSHSAKRRPRELTPQLSERDSIFATYYLAAESGASTPVPSAPAQLTKGEATDQDVVGSISLPGPLSSGAQITSSPLSPESRFLHKMHMAPESAPYSNPSPTPPLSREGAASQFVDEKRHGATELAKDGKEDWDRAKDKDVRQSARRHRSDEQIQATLANDGPMGHARSRKASHYLGLFKENAKEDKKRKSRERNRESHATAPDALLEDTRDTDSSSRVIAHPEAGKEQLDNKDIKPVAVRLGLPQAPAGFASPGAEAISISNGKQDETAVAEAEESVEWFSESAPSGAYPIRLLEEIRAHPSAQRHVKEKDREPLSGDALAKTRLPSAPQTPLSETGAEPMESPLKLPANSGTDGGDDSDKEHISSATYFPHQAPSPDDLQPRERSGSSYDDLGEPAMSPRVSSDTTPPTLELVDAAGPGSKQGQVSKDHQRVNSSEEPPLTESLPGPPPRRVNTGLSLASETDYDSPDDMDEGDELADVDHTPTATPRLGPIRAKKGPRPEREPLGAVELKPYKHQVGGHTKVFSFSKQAICKELNNKENQFYEVIERRHPELLEFMPRYLGVLNVTYTKAKRKQPPAVEDQAPSADSSEAKNGSTDVKAQGPDESHERVISHSKNFSAHDETIPRVVYANNMHIIPVNLFPNLPLANGTRPATAGGFANADVAIDTGKFSERPKSGLTNGHDDRNMSLPARPKMSDFPSWGATTVNYKLKDRVLRDVFSPPVVHPKHARRVRKPLTHESFNKPELVKSESSRRPRDGGKDELLSAALLKSASDLTPVNGINEPYRGGSAPTNGANFAKLKSRASPEEVPAKLNAVPERHITRRRSDQGLQRLQRDINTDERTGLTYYDDAEFDQGKDETVFEMDIERGNGREEGSEESQQLSSNNVPVADGEKDDQTLQPAEQPVTSEELPAPLSMPVNPLQAQLNSDERVRHFLLLEDLTANMTKPCVLDLKMGTRQYGIEANQKKRDSQRMKCKTTTSRQLGVRLCGMQVWNVKKQEYVFEDKYAGRDLRAGKDFQSALRRFLSDGVSNASVTRHIPVLLKKMSRLEQIVSQLPRYRFYASSLLLIYDGADLPSQRSHDIGSRGEAEPPGTGGHEGLEKAKDAPGKERQFSSNIDIRLVDFANCVTSQVKGLAEAPSPPAHANHPDRGYIRGLRSLRSYLQRIWMDINSEEAGSWVERGEGEAMGMGQKGAGNADQPDGWRKTGESRNDEGEVSE